MGLSKGEARPASLHVHLSQPSMLQCLKSDRCCVQGGWEDDETVEAAALRETVEEAGVRGTLEVSQSLVSCHLGPCRIAQRSLAVG